MQLTILFTKKWKLRGTQFTILFVVGMSMKYGSYAINYVVY